MQRWLALLVLVPTVATADPKRIAETQKLVVAQLDEFDRDETHQHGFKKWAKDAVAWFPGQYGERAELNRKAWATTPPPFLGSIKVAKSAIGWNKNWGWVVAQLDVSQRTNPDMRYGEEKVRYHYVGVVAGEAGSVKLEAMLLTETRPDHKLAAGKPKPSKPPAVGSLAWLLVSPGKIKLATDAAVSVTGSSEKEAALDAAGARKLLASWSKLELSIVGTPKEIVDGDRGVVLSEIDLKVGGKSVRLRGALVARKVGSEWEVVALSFGGDTP